MLTKPALVRRPRVEMVPLIDMFFLLLIFFIFGVFSMTTQQGLLVELPSAKTAAASQDPALAISVSAEGALLLNAAPISLAALPEALRQTSRSRPQANVAIHADRRVPYGRTIEVLDAVRQAGLQRVTFHAAQKPSNDR